MFRSDAIVGPGALAGNDFLASGEVKSDGPVRAGNERTPQKLKMCNLSVDDAGRGLTFRRFRPVGLGVSVLGDTVFGGKIL